MSTIFQWHQLTFESKFITVYQTHLKPGVGRNSFLSELIQKASSFIGYMTCAQGCMLGLMLWYHWCEILNSFWTKDPAFSICIVSHKLDNHCCWCIFQLYMGLLSISFVQKAQSNISTWELNTWFIGMRSHKYPLKSKELLVKLGRSSWPE